MLILTIITDRGREARRCRRSRWGAEPGPTRRSASTSPEAPPARLRERTERRGGTGIHWPGKGELQKGNLENFTFKSLKSDLKVTLKWFNGWIPFCVSPFEGQWGMADSGDDAHPHGLRVYARTCFCSRVRLRQYRTAPHRIGSYCG